MKIIINSIVRDVSMSHYCNKEKLWKVEQKNQIIQSKNRVIKAIEDYIVEKMYFNVDLIKVYLELIKG